MATITVRNLPDAFVKALKKLAERNHRSMEQEVRNMISHYVMDRHSAMKRIEASWKENKKQLDASRVERWIKQSKAWKK